MTVLIKQSANVQAFSLQFRPKRLESMRGANGAPHGTTNPATTSH